MRKTRKEKGITLVALIITIIVMMILVAVSVAIILRSDLLGTAKGAGTKYRDNMNAEQSFGTEQVQVGNSTMSNYISSINGGNGGQQGGPGVDSEEEQVRFVVFDETGSVIYDEYVERSITIAEWLAALDNSEPIKDKVSFGMVENLLFSGESKGYFLCPGGDYHSVGHAHATDVLEEDLFLYPVDPQTGYCPFPLAATEISAMARATKKEYYYGKTVDYGVEYDDQTADGYGTSRNAWEIFYIGPSPTNPTQNNIYLITRGYLDEAALSIGGYNGTTDFVDAEGNVVLNEGKFPAVAAGWLNKTYDPTAEPELQYSSTNINMKATQYLLDSTVTKWSGLKSEKAEWVIGAPTLEMFAASYNDYMNGATDIEYGIPTGDGYPFDEALSSLDSVPQGTYLNHLTSLSADKSRYWVAGPSSGNSSCTFYFEDRGSYIEGDKVSNSHAFRPVVCLKSNIQITWDAEEGQFNLD